MKPDKLHASNKNITIFSAATVPLKSGAGLNAFSLSKCIHSMGHPVRLVSFNWGKFRFRRETIDEVPIRRIAFFHKNILQKVGSLLIQFPFLVYYVLWSDLLLIFGPMQGYLAMISLGAVLGKRVVYRSTMLGMDDIQTLVAKYPKLSVPRKSILMSMYGYYSQNPAMTQRYLDAGGNPDKIYECAQGVDTNKFYPADEAERCQLRSRLNLPQDGMIVLSIGYLIERKGFREIFDALAEIEGEFTYIIVGDYDLDGSHYLAERRDEMSELYDYGMGLLDDHLNFTGPVENVDDYFRASDIFVLNSSMEGTPNVLLESMACGLASIVRKIDGVDGYLTHKGENSEVIGSREELVRALKILMNDSAYRKKLATNARKQILKKFSLDAVADGLLRKYLPQIQ